MEDGSFVCAKATAFGRQWAKDTFGRGFSKKYLYGQVVGLADRGRCKVNWEDSEVTEATIRTLKECTEEDYNDAVEARKPKPDNPIGLCLCLRAFLAVIICIIAILARFLLLLALCSSRTSSRTTSSTRCARAR